MCTLPRFAVALAVATATASAQWILTYDPTATGLGSMTQTQLPSPAAPPVFVGSLAATGLAFLPAPAYSGDNGPCGNLNNQFGATWTAVSGARTYGSFGVGISGLPPGTLALLGLDWGFDPAFPRVNSTGCGLGLLPGSPSLATVFTVAGPAAYALWELPLVRAPVGLGPIYAQAGFQCAADPAGFTVTPVLEFTVSGL